MKHELVSVIIPFYQREKGILKRSVDSILKQGAAVNEIIIVDDGSPIKASGELDVTEKKWGIKINIIEQKNAGPAAARNRGLDNLDPKTRYVAFLDSDDEWADNHLSRALGALGKGYDFYFSNYQQLNQTISAFEREKRIVLDEHEPLNNTGIFAWKKDMFNQILTGNVIATSSMIFHYEKFSRIQFREEYIHAGEDYLFWMDFTCLSSKFVFSNACEVIYGKGINIYSGSGWGTEEHFARLHYELKYRKAIIKLFSLDQVQKSYVKQKVFELRLAIARDLMHRIRKRKKIRLPVLLSHFAVDPLWIYYFIVMSSKIFMKKIEED